MAKSISLFVLELDCSRNYFKSKYVCSMYLSCIQPFLKSIEEVAMSHKLERKIFVKEISSRMKFIWFVSNFVTSIRKLVKLHSLDWSKELSQHSIVNGISTTGKERVFKVLFFNVCTATTFLSAVHMHLLRDGIDRRWLSCGRNVFNSSFSNTHLKRIITKSGWLYEIQPYRWNLPQQPQYTFFSFSIVDSNSKSD